MKFLPFQFWQGTKVYVSTETCWTDEGITYRLPVNSTGTIFSLESYKNEPEPLYFVFLDCKRCNFAYCTPRDFVVLA